MNNIGDWLNDLENVATLIKTPANELLPQFRPFSARKLKFINTLILNNNGIIHLPAELFTLVSLEYLAINGNELDFLPAGVEKLENLKGLFVTNNNLFVLPVTIKNLRKLEALDLTGNKHIVLQQSQAVLLAQLKYAGDLTGYKIVPDLAFG